MIGDRNMVWRFVALPSGARSAYVWHWLCEDEQGEVVMRSAKGYAYYYECLEDARKHGYGGLAEAGSNTASDAGDAAPDGPKADDVQKKEQV
ncbi:MAG: hypothetical protein ACM3SS_04160 [Rhodospirillaceae bacterium]